MARYEVYVTIYDNSRINGVSGRFNAVYSLSDKAREERTEAEEKRGARVVFEKRIEAGNFYSVRHIALKTDIYLSRANRIDKFDRKGLLRLLE